MPNPQRFTSVFTRSGRPLTISNLFFFYVCYFSFCFSFLFFFFLFFFFSVSFLLCFCLFWNCFSLLFLLFFFFFFFFLLFSLSSSFSFSFSLSLFFSFSFFFVSFVFSFWVCCLVSSFFGWCCLFFLLLLGGAAWFLPSLALFSSPFTWCCLAPLWVVSPVWCCCSPSPVWWCFLPSPPLGGAAFSHVFCWVVLLGLLLVLVVLLFFLLLFSGAAFHPLHWVGRRSPCLLLGWCCLVSSFYGWSCCFPLSCSVVLLLVFGWCCVSPLLLSGAAWSPPSLALFSSPFTWCCLVSSLFGWSLLFGGAAFIPSFGCGSFFPCLLLGGAVWFHPSFWVVLFFSLSFFVVLLGLLFPWRCFPLLLRGCCLAPSLGGLSCLVLLFFLLLFGGAAFLLTLWVGLLYPMSSQPSDRLNPSNIACLSHHCKSLSDRWRFVRRSSLLAA